MESMDRIHTFLFLDPSGAFCSLSRELLKFSPHSEAEDKRVGCFPSSGCQAMGPLELMIYIVKEHSLFE